jgi:hypothetical protein
MIVEANVESGRFEIKNLATREQKSVDRSELLGDQPPA